MENFERYYEAVVAGDIVPARAANLSRLTALPPDPVNICSIYKTLDALEEHVQLFTDDMAEVAAYVQTYDIYYQVYFLRELVKRELTLHRDLASSPCRTKAYTDWFSKPELRAALGV